MSVYALDPLNDNRWSDFLEHDQRASLFHTTPWLHAIAQTYGYRPVVYTTTPGGSTLTNGIAFCEVKSWLTGRRMVSVPFSDHCDPLVDSSSMDELADALKARAESGEWKYIELRPVNADLVTPAAFGSESFALHMLDLRLSHEQLLQNTHKTAVRGTLKRAQREMLVHVSGNTDEYLRAFYRLMLLTRRKHGVPPQPIEWFQNLAACLGDRFQIHLARKDDKEIAAIVTIRFKTTSVYKYAASDREFNSLGGIPFLIWNAILEAKAAGAEYMDFGRSDLGNTGLLQFKERWGATSSRLTYLRWAKHLPRKSDDRQSAHQHSMLSRVMARMIAHVPDAIFRTMGRLLYRHVG